MATMLALTLDQDLQIILVATTALLALFTGAMANSTRQVAIKTELLAKETHELSRETAVLAKETVAATILTDRHHQEAMMPLVVLEELHIVSYQSELVMSAILRNVGAGVATDVRIWIGELGEKQSFGPCAVNGAREVTMKVVALGNAPQEKIPIVVTVFYDNVFGSEGKTEHFVTYTELGPYPIRITSPQIIDRIKALE